MSPTKLGNIFGKRKHHNTFFRDCCKQLFYEVVAKFRKTNFFCNRRLSGYEFLLVVGWGKRFRDDAVVTSLKALRKQLKTTIIDFVPAGKQKLGLAKSSRNCNIPNLCILRFCYVEVQTVFHAPAISCITLSM